jgi:hypothetical protein
LDKLDWNSQYRCALALQSIKRTHPLMPIDTQRLLNHAEREVRLLANEPRRDIANNRRVQFVFHLFGALYDPETLDLCWHALQTDDWSLRGTALEYLENRVPPELWALLQPVLAPGHVKSGSKRTLNQAAQDLLAQAKSLRPKRREYDDTINDVLD